MRIALLSHEYPAETGFGGIGTYTWFHARALVRLGHDVHVLAGASNPGARTEEHDGVRVHRYRGTRTEAIHRQLGRWKWWWTRERVRNAIDMWSGLRELERLATFDVVEAPECGAEGLLANWFGSAPSVVRFHSPSRLIMRYYDVQDGDVRACGLLESGSIAGASALTSTSHSLAAALREQLRLTRQAPVIHNGIDVDWFDATAQVDFRAKHGIPANRPIVLFLGRLERRKGIELCPDVVRAIVERHEVAFVFAGEDLFGFAEHQMYPALAGARIRGSVHLLGRLPITEVRSCVRQADIVFLPSLWESCPYSCLEAMAAGRAIVCSDAGGLPELVRHRIDALVVPSGDTQAFVAAITELLEDDALRERLGTSARAAVRESFSDVATARRSVDLYRTLSG